MVGLTIKEQAFLKRKACFGLKGNLGVFLGGY